MTILRAPLYLLALLLFSALHGAAQAVTLAGLRSNAGNGSFKAAQYAPDGSLILLCDQGDGLRLLKTDASATTILAQAQQGSPGDAGVALALDPAGNIYVAGTSTSGTLSGTSGSAFPAPADSTTNSFVARFDSNLNLVFLTFLGAGQTVVSGLSATTDAVFLTGATYSTTLPVTPGAAFAAPALGSNQNGFVERFTPDGASLTYATYLTGASGDTAPAAIVADVSDDAYVTGLTSSATFPATSAALQPRMLGSTSGFLTRLTPAGDGLIFSTFIPGSGLTGIALDATTPSLLLTGNIALGQFPIATVTQPIANIPYQSLVRLSTDGQTVLNSALLVPGSDSHVTAGPNGTSWVSGTLTVPLLPPSTQVGSSLGDAFLLHVPTAAAPDDSFRFGGAPVANASFATLTAATRPPAVSTDSLTAILPATLTATLSPAIAAGTPFDVPLTAPTSALPNTPASLSITCSGPAQCSATTGLLAAATTQTSTTASLSLSTADTPNLTLRNTGSATASGLVIAPTGYTASTDCGTTLSAGAQCTIALSGSGPGTLSVSATNAPAINVPLPATALSPNPLALSAAELDYGIVTASSAVSRTLTVTNLSSAPQTFTSTADAAPTSPPYSLAETASTCAGSSAAHTVPANSSCSIALSLTASTSSANDGAVTAHWKIGARDILVTGITQAAALSVSAAEIDFGVRFATLTPQLPRFLYLSNSSDTSIPHLTVSLPANSPFAVTDTCPPTIAPRSVCQIQIAYNQTAAPSQDSATLTLDQGLVVQITGALLPAAAAAGTGTDPSLTVAPGAVSFSNPVLVTALSSETQVLTLTNTGSTPLPVSAAVSGDFVLTNDCAASLNPLATCLLLLQFAPSQPGLRQGLLTISAGAASAPAYVSVTGTASPLLAPNNGSLDLGQTYIGEPSIAWYQIQGSLPNLTASASGAFAVALVPALNGSHAAVSNSDFAPTVSAACPGCWLAIEFLPQAAGTATSNLALSSPGGGHAYTLALSGTAVPVQGLLITPSNQDFGAVSVGSTSAPLTFTLTNLLAPAAPVTIQSATASGDFTLVQNTTGGASCTGVLSSTASCFVELTFAPTSPGTRSGTLAIATSSGTAAVTLTGTGTPASGLSISPATLNFINQPGAAATQASLTVTNTSAWPITVATPTTSSPSFTLSSNCGTQAAGSTCTVAVTFTPAASTTSGTISIPARTTAAGQPSTTLYSVPVSAGYTDQQAGLLLLPAQANFGAQPTATLGQTFQFTLRNTSSDTRTISIAAPQDFPLSAPADCAALAPGASCSFSATFLPAVGGPLTGSLVATSTSAAGASSEAIGYLIGYGTGSGTLNLSSSLPDSTSLDFGQVASGQASTQTLTLTNAGAAPLSLRRIASTPPFFDTTTCLQPLQPAESCTVTLTYAPGPATTSVPRSDSGALTIESDATSSPDVVDLSGIALAGSDGSPDTSESLDYGLSQGSLTFANTLPGSVSDPQEITVTNSGAAPVQFGTILSASPSFQATSTCSTLQPGAACSIAVSFSPPVGANGAIPGWLEIPSNAPNALEFVSLLGLSSNAAVSVSPAALNFQPLGVGQSAQLALTVTNSAALPITLGQALASGDYSASAGSCPTAGPLPAGESCSVVVTFSPTTTGTRTGTLTLSTTAAAQPITIPLTGTGLAPQLQATPASIAFGPTALASTATLPLQLSNSGTTTLTGISGAITGPDAADFSVTSPCPSTSLPAAADCTAQVAFAPTAQGQRSATLTLTSSDPFGPLTIPLTGTGTQAQGITLTVNGATTATVVVSPGAPASYSLALTPLGGFSGLVALACTPINPGPYASCSLANPQLPVNGSGQNSAATITTTSGAIASSASTLLLLSPVFAYCRRRRNRYARTLSALAACLTLSLLAIFIAGCGGGYPSAGQNVTPAGSYQYQVTATSLENPSITSSVTLNLTVK